MYSKILKPSADGKPRAWFEVKARAELDQVEILIYDEIGGFFGVDAAELVQEISAIRAAEILVRIHSGGGDAFDGFAIFNALRQAEPRVVVQIDHSAFSAASYVALAGDEVRMAENGLFMIHEPWTITVGTAGELRQTADLLEKVTGQMVATYEKFSDLSAEDLRAALAAETFYTAEEALAAGFVTEIIEDQGRPASKGRERRSPADKNEKLFAAVNEAGVPRWEEKPGPSDSFDKDKAAQAVYRSRQLRLARARA